MPMCVLAIYKSICMCARAFVCVSYSLTSTMHAVVEQWQYRVKLLGCLPLTQFQCRIPMCVSTRINFAVLFVQGYFSLLLLTSKCWNEANEKYALVITTSFHVQKPQHKFCSHIKFHHTSVRQDKSIWKKTEERSEYIENHSIAGNFMGYTVSMGISNVMMRARPRLRGNIFTVFN